MVPLGPPPPISPDEVIANLSDLAAETMHNAESALKDGPFKATEKVFRGVGKLTRRK
jgi:hypothetical protein